MKSLLGDEILLVEEENDIEIKEKNVETKLNYWLLENMKIMEELTVKEPVSWSEQDCGG